MRWDFIFVWLASKANFRKKGVRHDDMGECLNCGFQLEESHLFCPECGQKIHYSKLSVWSLVAEFFASLFDLDSSLYRSLFYLPVPGYLSRKFMEGKRKRFLNPIRFFLVALVIHIAVITNLIPLDTLNRENIESLEKLGQAKMHYDFIAMKDSLASQFAISDIDSLEQAIFKEIRTSGDSITVNDSQSSGGTTFRTTLTEKKYKFRRADIYDMPIDTFMDRYSLTTYWERVISTQVLRAARDPSGAVRFAVGNLIWIIFSVILLIGLFLKLLYIRRNRYYVEHLVLLFNIHTFSFLIATIGLWAGFRFIGPDNNLDDAAYFIIVLFLFLSMKYYYQQGWIKTFIKFVMTGFIYLSLLITMVVMVSLISFLFFN